MVCDGFIASLDFSYRFSSGEIAKEKKSLKFIEKSGINSNFELKNNDFLTEIQANFNKEAIFQLIFKTNEGISHKINYSSFSSKTNEKSVEVDLSKTQGILFYPLYRILIKNPFLYDILCFNAKKKTFLLFIIFYSFRYLLCFFSSIRTSFQKKKAKAKDTQIQQSPISLLTFSDKNFLKNIEINDEFRISKARIWLDSDNIYGLKLFYEEIEKKSLYEGLDHIPQCFLNKPFEEIEIEGKIKKISYKIVENCVVGLIFMSEIIDGTDKKTLEYVFGSKIENGKEIKIEDLARLH